jgi:hypothetical protein
MTNEETLHALAAEYGKPYDKNKNPDVFSPWSFIAGHASRDSEVQGLKAQLNQAVYEMDKAKTDRDKYISMERDHRIMLESQLASQKQAAQGLVEACEKFKAEFNDKYSPGENWFPIACIIPEAIAQYRKTLEGV